MERNIKSHLTKVHQIAKEYERKGYKVIKEPRGSDKPEFLTDYQPDLIASNDIENVIVEVTQRSNKSSISRLRNLADVVNQQEKWRFELIMISDEESIFPKSTAQNYSYEEIEKHLRNIRSWLRSDLVIPTFISCWAVFESLSRQLLLEQKKSMQNKASLTLIKTLFSFGYLGKRDYDTLEKLYLIRNNVVHGYKDKGLDKKTVTKLLEITLKLLKEKQLQ
jgi:hypothetical protein